MNTAANKKLIQQVFADSASRSGTTFVDSLAEDACWTVTGQNSWSQQFKGRDAIMNGLPNAQVFLGAALHQFIVPLEVTFAPRQY